MPVNHELTFQVMTLALIAVGLFILFTYSRKYNAQEKYYHFDEDEKDALIHLMSLSLLQKTPLEEWKTYLDKLGVTQEQFNELLSEVENKMLNP